MNELAGKALQVDFLIMLVLKATLFLAVAGVLTSMLRRQPAALRHWLWSVTLAATLLLPAASMLLPAWELAVLPPEATFPGTVTGIPETGNGDNRALDVPGMTPGTPVSELQTQSTPTDPAPKRNPGTGLIVVLLLVAGIGFLSLVLRMLSELRWLRMVVAEAVPAEQAALRSAFFSARGHLKIRRPVRLLLSHQVPVPIACGLIRPSIVLPLTAVEWEPRTRRTVLLHELAHIKRHDFLTNLLAEFACAVYWFNPFVWIAARKLRVEREFAADDLVLRQGTPDTDYAHQLLEIARPLATAPSPSARMVAMANQSHLKLRIRHILASTCRRQPLTRRSAALTTLIAIPVLLPLTLVELHSTPVAPSEVHPALMDLRDPQSAPPTHAVENDVPMLATSDYVAMLSKAPAEQRIDALHKLAELADRRTFHPVFKTLFDKNPRVRTAALSALHGIGCDPAFAAVTLGLNDVDSAVRSTAARLLGQFPGKPFDTRIEQVLYDYEPPFVRYFQVRFGGFANLPARTYLERARNDDNPDVRAAARQSLHLLDGTVAPPVSRSK